jgi:protocatechuate 3,4-dioxygenase beta subunit
VTEPLPSARLWGKHRNFLAPRAEYDMKTDMRTGYPFVAGLCLAAATTAAFLWLPGRAAAGELRGRVVSDRRPIPGATVSAIPFEAPLEAARREARGGPLPAPVATATVISDGSFALKLAPGAPSVQLRVEAQGFQAAPLARVFDGTDTADVGDVALAKSATLTGRVVDGHNGVVAGALVSIEPGDGGSRERLPARLSVKTAPDGTFRIEGVSITGNRVRVEAAGFATTTRAEVRGGVLSTPILLSAAVTLTGSVKRPDGRTPASGVVVRFEGTGPTRWVEGAADGTFRLSDAPAATGRVVAEAGALGRAEAPVVVSGSTPPLTLVLSPPTRIVGRVVNAKTLQPIPRARIEARGHGRVTVARSGPDGRYGFDALTHGTYDLTVDEPRFVPYGRTGIRVGPGESKPVDLPLTLGVSLAGRVVDERDAPVAGAVGRLSRGAPGGLGARGRGRRNAPTEISFRTGADGTFRAERLPPGTNERLTVSHPQFETKVVAGLSLPPGGARKGLNVVLRRGLEIAGTVRDSDGHVVEGAEIDLRPSASERRGGGRFGFDPATFETDRVRVTSEANGTFRVAGLEPGAYSVQARRDGFAEATIDPVRLEAGAVAPPVDLWLLPGATISGFVRRPDGSGAKGFIVRARSEEGEARFFGGGPVDPTAADGAFSISGLRAGETYSLVILGRGGAPLQREGIVAPAADVEVQVGGAGRITGRVIDAQSQKPLTEFAATYAADNGWAGPGGRARGGGGPPRGARGPTAEDEDDDSSSSADGTFQIDDVPPGTWSVTVEADGYERARVSGVTVREGETTADVQVKVTRGRVLAGRTMDALTGQPVPGVSVTGSNASGGGPGGGAAAFALTDADGRFELAGLALGTYRLQTQHPDYAEASQIVDLAQPATNTEIRLSSGGTLAGLVTSESGAPLPGATVSLRSGAGGGPFGGGGPGATTVTDEAGAFHFDRLTAGRYTVNGTLGARASAPLDVALAAGESRSDLRIALGGGTTLRGQVSGLGSDLRGTVNVAATGPNSYFAGVRPTVDGAFSLSGVPAGSIHLRATAGSLSTGTRSASTDVAIADGQTEAEADIVFTAGDTLSGTITRGGEPESGVTVTVAPAGQGPTGAARTDATGSYTVSGLRDGDYTVMASPSRGAARRQSVTISGDQTLDFSLPLSAIGGVVVEAGSGLPLAGADVSVDSGDVGPRGGSRSTTDSNGRFDIEGLDPQSYVLTARLASYAFDKRTVDASADASTALTIELRRGEGLGVRALDGVFGVPLHGLFAEARDNASSVVFTGRVSLDSDGRGEVPSLRPGVYAVRLGAPGYAPLKLGVTIPSPTLELAFTPGGTVEIRVGPGTLSRSPQARLLDSAGMPFPVGPFSTDGWFALSTPDRRIEHVTPGGYTFVVADGTSKQVTVTEGGTAVVELP